MDLTSLSLDEIIAHQKSIPTGQWDHGGFEELYGCASRDTAPFSSLRRGQQVINRIDLARKVGIHIINVAPTVGPGDLKELFKQYLISSISINYNINGESLGTADVVTDRATARELIANLNGVVLDTLLSPCVADFAMHFYMIDCSPILLGPTTNMKNRLAFNIHLDKTRRPYLTPDRMHKRYIHMRMIGGQLDRELEEYMIKRNENKKRFAKSEL
ncbi:unnamed protein product [Thelazia callipaeda]|uniref:RRM domain-containing protein n=1 Tax=Thelazia callipaeda TaxID=103827 RepID=A0A0N5D6H8_THECL|nr:unnamed protein product [Thelazia callipaeda]